MATESKRVNKTKQVQSPNGDQYVPIPCIQELHTVDQKEFGQEHQHSFNNFKTGAKRKQHVVKGQHEGDTAWSDGNSELSVMRVDEFKNTDQKEFAQERDYGLKNNKDDPGPHKKTHIRYYTFPPSKAMDNGLDQEPDSPPWIKVEEIDRTDLVDQKEFGQEYWVDLNNPKDGSDLPDDSDQGEVGEDDPPNGGEGWMLDPFKNVLDVNWKLPQFRYDIHSTTDYHTGDVSLGGGNPGNPGFPFILPPDGSVSPHGCYNLGCGQPAFVLWESYGGSAKIFGFVETGTLYGSGTMSISTSGEAKLDKTTGHFVSTPGPLATISITSWNIPPWEYSTIPSPVAYQPLDYQPITAPIKKYKNGKPITFLGGTFAVVNTLIIPFVHSAHRMQGIRPFCEANFPPPEGDAPFAPDSPCNRFFVFDGAFAVGDSMSGPTGNYPQDYYETIRSGTITISSAPFESGGATWKATGVYITTFNKLPTGGIWCVQVPKS